jgi:hypothetical protein
VSWASAGQRCTEGWKNITFKINYEFDNQETRMAEVIE